MKLGTIPLNAFIEIVEDLGDGATVMYGEKVGFLEKRFIERYERNLPVGLVDFGDMQTATEADFEQFVIYEGAKQTNFCGQISLAQILGLSLPDFLAKWKELNPTMWRRIIKQGVNSTGTHADDLIELAKLFGRRSMKIPLLRYTPTFMQDLLKLGSVICAVKVDNMNGSLREGEIRHWVVLLGVVLERKGMGLVTVYNPIENCVEAYSWAEFVTAAGIPTVIQVSNE